MVSSFESRVILDGSQTVGAQWIAGNLFESRVILDGSQTRFRNIRAFCVFESRVILDESQTGGRGTPYIVGLRVMLF